MSTEDEECSLLEAVARERVMTEQAGKGRSVCCSNL
jgi:hypothetical protein